MKKKTALQLLATDSFSARDGWDDKGRGAYAADMGNWESYLFGHFHRSLYAYVLYEMSDEILDDKAYWKIVGQAWVGCDNNTEDMMRWMSLLFSDRPCKECIMADYDKKVYDALPEVMTVYRGCNKYTKHGMSWTLDRAVAEKFRRTRHCIWVPRTRSGKLGKFVTPRTRILEMTIPKSAVIAYFGDRDESEILTFVRYRKTKEVTNEN